MKIQKLLDKSVRKALKTYYQIDEILYPHAKEKSITAAQYLAIELAESEHLLIEAGKVHDKLLRKIS